MQSKLVSGGRGGYCFEQNGLFRLVLDALGFKVTPLIARVVRSAPPDRPLSGRCHMLLKVTLDEGDHIADVGFGGQLVSAPLKLQTDLEQETAEALMRLQADGDVPILQTKLPSGWDSFYRFTLEPAELADYQMSNYTSTRPPFFLTNNLLTERRTPAVGSTVFNRRLTRRYRDGHADVTELTSAEDLARAGC